MEVGGGISSDELAPFFVRLFLPALSPYNRRHEFEMFFIGRWLVLGCSGRWIGRG